jgi:hypothetical protein
VATWAESAKAEPDLPAFALERMEGRIVYQATLRPEYSDDEMPVYRRWKPSSGEAAG